MLFALAIPSLPRCLDPVHNLPLDRLRCAPVLLLPAHCLRAGLVHWYGPPNSLGDCEAQYCPRHKQFDVASNGSAGNLGINKPLTLLSCAAVAYTLGIYLLNLFLAFLTPKFD